jgi:hypothetical protein
VYIAKEGRYPFLKTIENPKINADRRFSLIATNSNFFFLDSRLRGNDEKEARMEAPIQKKDLKPP